MKSSSLKVNIWKYLIIFSLSIILFLWLFQIIFINTFYEFQKTKQVKQVANRIILYNDDIDTTELDQLSFENDVCIEVVKNYITIYSSNSINKGCVLGNYQYKLDFFNSGQNNQTFKLVNPRFNNKSLVYALKLNDDISIFVNSSLQPLDTTVSLLSKQLIIVSIIVLSLAFLIGYFVSKLISYPIEKINKKALELGQGNYNFSFDENSKIKELNELASTLNYTKNELEHTDEIRRDLLANVSHDLKTPLTMIKGYAEMVRDLTYKNKKKREENLNVIIEETDRLNMLVDDILALSKIQANPNELKIEEFDLIQLIETIIKRYDLLIEQESYKFECSMPKSLSIKADKKKIEQVIYNLINNAIHYTGDDNKVIINVVDSDNIVVSIKDTGKGINQKDLPHIWDRYYHSKKEHKRNKVGTGLGLSIVKTILEAHHYKYGVESKDGTTFYFIIPK